jgi:hypothetical protein
VVVQLNGNLGTEQKKMAVVCFKLFLQKYFGDFEQNHEERRARVAGLNYDNGIRFFYLFSDCLSTAYLWQYAYVEESSVWVKNFGQDLLNS